MAKSFTAQLQAFKDKAELKVLAVFRESAQQLSEEANTPETQGGRMPVDTAFLRNSIRGSTEGMPSDLSEAIGIALLKTKLGDTFYMGWTAVYARRMELGFFGTDSLGRTYSQAGKGFMRSAAQNWPAIVARVASEVSRRG